MSKMHTVPRVHMLSVSHQDVLHFYELITKGRSAVPSDWLEAVRQRLEKVHGHILKKSVDAA